MSNGMDRHDTAENTAARITALTRRAIHGCRFCVICGISLLVLAPLAGIGLGLRVHGTGWVRLLVGVGCAVAFVVVACVMAYMGRRELRGISHRIDELGIPHEPAAKTLLSQPELMKREEAWEIVQHLCPGVGHVLQARATMLQDKEKPADKALTRWKTASAKVSAASDPGLEIAIEANAWVAAIYLAIISARKIVWIMKKKSSVGGGMGEERHPCWPGLARRARDCALNALASIDRQSEPNEAARAFFRAVTDAAQPIATITEEAAKSDPGYHEHETLHQAGLLTIYVYRPEEMEEMSVFATAGGPKVSVGDTIQYARALGNADWLLRRLDRPWL